MLDKFPGFLGYGGIIAIRADWPIYPSGIGWEIALVQLGNFPNGTEFYEVSDIDRCILLINQNLTKVKDPFDYKFFHTALWHDDILQLKRNGFVEGILEVNEYDFERLKFERLRTKLKDDNLLEEDEHGNIIFYAQLTPEKLTAHRHKKPRIEDYDELDLMYTGRIFIPERLKVTEKGLQQIKEISLHLEYDQSLRNLVNPLMEINRFDTAVRDASLLLEAEIKKFHKVNLFGARLIDYHINDIVSHNDNFFSAAIKVYRGELRTIFSFIRNDFAHNFRVLTEEQCKVIIYRINRIYIEFKDVVQVYYR